MAYTNNGWMWGIGDLDKRVTELEEGGPSPVTPDGSQIDLTGYAIGTEALAAVDPADSVNDAIAKLEKRIADLEAEAG